MTDRESIYSRAQGRWRDILRHIGVPHPVLSGKHQACPFGCGSQKDGFRFTDVDKHKQPGGGGFYCNGCGAGNGVDFVMRFKGVDFKGACEEIESVIGKCAVYVAKATAAPDAAEKRDAMAWLWKNRARPLTGEDIASRYLLRRGIPKALLPLQNPAVRWVPDQPMYEGGQKVGEYHCMLARVIAPDNKSSSLHRTYLAEPGDKAPGVSRKMMAFFPEGGAVRLQPADSVMGIAEGIETALAAAALHCLPVWAALTAGGLSKWVPPDGVKHVEIFADGDENHVGEEAAAILARRLHKLEITSRIRVPADEYWEGKGADWLDVWVRDHGWKDDGGADGGKNQDGKAA